MRWSEYSSLTGMFTGRQFSGPQPPTLKTDDKALMEGWFDAKSQRRDLNTGLVVDYQPSSPGEGYEWIHDDENGKRVRRWVKSAEVIQREALELHARATIDDLERRQARAVREALLGQGTDRLAQIDSEIAEQRAIINSSRHPQK